MVQVIIKENEAGQRLDKFLHKFMPLAPASFFYKMLRKKNITLNGKKAEGKEKLLPGDQVSFYLAEETMKGFQNASPLSGEYAESYKRLKGITVVFENEHILVLNKPAGILSQKADPKDLSLNEWMIGYLLNQKKLTEGELSTFKPSICNRLDRNTMGLVIGSKTLIGSQTMNQMIAGRQIKKFYRMVVKGSITKEETLEGYLIKNPKTNKVCLIKDSSEDAAYIKTRYYPIREYKLLNGSLTLVEAELITGRPHQIRVHLASTGHPLLGDYKYGERSFNEPYKKSFHVESQLLYACRLEFPKMEPPLEDLGGLVVEVPEPEIFQKLLAKENR